MVAVEMFAACGLDEEVQAPTKPFKAVFCEEPVADGA
jgi:hypothetical protein